MIQLIVGTVSVIVFMALCWFAGPFISKNEPDPIVRMIAGFGFFSGLAAFVVAGIFVGELVLSILSHFGVELHGR